MDNIATGKRFRIFIKFAKIKQIDLAKYFECYHQDVSKMLNGQLHLQRYANKILALGCDLNWLFTGTGSMFAENEAGMRLKEKAEAEEKLRKISETKIDYNSKKKNQPGLEAIPLNLSEEDILKIADRISENLMSRQAAAGKIPEN